MNNMYNLTLKYGDVFVQGEDISNEGVWEWHKVGHNKYLLDKKHLVLIQDTLEGVRNVNHFFLFGENLVLVYTHCGVSIVSVFEYDKDKGVFVYLDK